MEADILSFHPMDFNKKQTEQSNHFLKDPRYGESNRNSGHASPVRNDYTSRCPTSDGRLVPSAIAGNKEAFQQLYNKYHRLVTSMLYQKISCKEDVEDLVQEAFLRAWRALPKLRKPDRFLPWLMSIARRLGTDLYRSNARKPMISNNNLNLISSSDDSCTRISAAEEQIRIFNNLRKLSEKYRLVLTMRFLEGLSPADIASRLCEPHGTIRNRIFRALNKLETLVNQDNSKGGK